MSRFKKIRYHKCSRCGKKAVWLYMPSGSGRVLYCDDCVPRGCSCNNHDIKWDGEPEEGREVVWLPKNYKSLEKEMTRERRPDSFHYQYLDKGRLLPCGEYFYDEEGFEIERKVTLVNYNRLREIMTAIIKKNGCPKLLEYATEMLSKCNVKRYNIDYNEFMRKLDHINHGFFSKQYTRVLKLLSARMQPYRSTMWLDDWEKLNIIDEQNSNIDANKSRREESTENTGVPAE